MAKDLLVGSTGFVGGNLAAKHAFAAVCHSTDIAAQFGAKPDLCVYAGVPAAMFLANADPDADLAVMAAARENLRQIAPKQLVLISSIAVYADSREKDEQSPMTPDGLPAYGRNRLQLERWVREDYPNVLIVRLPALYGIGLKKNFLFDLHTITPAMLKPEKYTELAQKSPLVRDGYTLADNGFYKLNGAVDAAALREFFAGNDFNALAFTDSRSRYQFYHLARLWQDVQTALQNGLTTLNLTGRTSCPSPRLIMTCAAGMLRCWAGRTDTCVQNSRSWMRSAPLCAHGGTEDVRTETCNFQYCVG